MQNKGITKRQIKLIHTLKNRLGWNDLQYRMFLMENSPNFASSCLDLSEEAAENIIIKMRAEAVKKGIWQDYAKIKKYESLDGRERMATGAQLRKIEAMWKEICTVKDEKGRAKILREILWKKFKVSDLRFLEDYQVKKVIKMLEAMKQRRGKNATNTL